MFSSTGKFNQIPCPVEDTECSLLNCPFLHQQDAAQRIWLHMPADESCSEIAPKRQRLLDGKAQIQTSGAARSSLVKPKNKPFIGALMPQHESQPVHINVVDKEPYIADADNSHMESAGSPYSATKRISPPPVRGQYIPAAENETTGSWPLNFRPQEILNPRLLQHNPAGHQTRLLYLTKLHEGMTRLNRETTQSSDPTIQQLAVTDDELIAMALDEEEKIAKENPSVYANVVKLRMVQYKKMTLEQWKAMRQETIKSRNEAALGRVSVNGVKVTRERSLSSELTPAEEVQISRRLLASQDGLTQYGYQVSPPTELEIVKAVAGVKTAHGWEECERCKSRFQVYPDRREDGALTSGGRCAYHWGRMVRPNKDRVQPISGSNNTIYGCCKASLGSPGCVTADTHVFKVYDAKRLATLLQFEKTPENSNVHPEQAVAFDCEMCFTVKGFELVRLTAITWPEGKDLLDVLVRPLGTLLDLNSRWSGIWPKDFVNAKPWDEDYQARFIAQTTSEPEKDRMAKETPRMVGSPVEARTLLFRYLSPTTPLIGHGIENDLNAVRIVHPSIIDTILLYPHAKGMPFRMSLKALVRQHLWRDIQVDGASGHDSKEDAKAAGDLVRLRVIREWIMMKRNGWILENGAFVEPSKSSKADPKVPTGPEGFRAGEKRPLILDDA